MNHDSLHEKLPTGYIPVMVRLLVLLQAGASWPTADPWRYGWDRQLAYSGADVSVGLSVGHPCSSDRHRDTP